MTMKTIRSSILCFVVLLLFAPLLCAQDLSKYRHFTLGMSLTKVLERTEQSVADVKVVHDRPALIQEVTWWPPNISETSLRSEGVEQILFRSEEHTSELQSQSNIVCRLLLEKKKAWSYYNLLIHDCPEFFFRALVDCRS